MMTSSPQVANLTIDNAWVNLLYSD